MLTLTFCRSNDFAYLEKANDSRDNIHTAGSHKTSYQYNVKGPMKSTFSPQKIAAKRTPIELRTNSTEKLYSELNISYRKNARLSQFAEHRPSPTKQRTELNNELVLCTVNSKK